MEKKRQTRLNERQAVSKWASGEIGLSELQDNLTRIVQKRYKNLINEKKVKKR